jgi:hypothetical protein
VINHIETLMTTGATIANTGKSRLRERVGAMGATTLDPADSFAGSPINGLATTGKPNMSRQNLTSARALCRVAS